MRSASLELARSARTPCASARSEIIRTMSDANPKTAPDNNTSFQDRISSSTTNTLAVAIWLIRTKNDFRPSAARQVSAAKTL